MDLSRPARRLQQQLTARHYLYFLSDVAMIIDQLRLKSGVSRRSQIACGTLLSGEGLATYYRIDGIEDAQSLDICNASNDDRIAQILNLALPIGKARPRRKTRTVWIA
jgi:hypothetical protein